MRLTTRIARWTLLLTVLAVFAGCSESLLGPPPLSGGGGGGPVNPAPHGPDILVVHPDGTTSWTQPPLEWTPNMTGTVPGEVPAQRASAWKLVDGDDGADVQCGRFFLSIPPGAFQGSGMVTMSTLDSTIMICDVEIHPEGLNRFTKPVRLSMSTTGANCGTDSLTMYWYDPVARDWVDLGADKDLSDNPECAGAPYPANMTGIGTSLGHFSRYGGGKAGW